MAEAGLVAGPAGVAGAGGVWSEWSPDGATAGTVVEWIRALGHNRSAPAGIIVELFDLRRLPENHGIGFLFREDLPAEVRDAAIVHPDRKVRILAAEAGHLTAAQWARLSAGFEGDGMRRTILELQEDHNVPRSERRVGIGSPPEAGMVPPATPAEIAEWAAAVPETAADQQSYCLWWIAELHDDPDAMRQLAAVPRREVRRSVARARHLPPDVLELLGRDDDRVVQLFLSESCDDTPAEVLLDVWRWWDGSFSFPGRPRNHPNFPTTGLLRFAGDADPRMRLLALGDAAAGTALVDRLAADPDLRVRREAVADPRVSPAVLAEALLDERFAAAAAKNPALPVPVMRRMVDAGRRLAG